MTGGRWGALVCLAILVSVSPSLRVHAARADALREYDNAVGNEARGEYYTAILNLRRCLTENPDFIPAHLLMGDVLVKLGKYLEADSSYVVAEQGDPQSLEAATRRLKLYALYLKDFQQAEKLLTDASARFGQSPEIHYYKALVLMGKHNYLNARSELQLALALREKYFDARKLQIEIESIIGDPKRILDAAGQILNDFPDIVEGYEIAVGYLLKAQTPVAKVLDLFANAPPTLVLNRRFGRLLARLNLMAERYEEAAEILKQAPVDQLTAEEVEDFVYLKSLSEVARGRQMSGIQILADYLREVPDRPYLQMQLDLWLLRYAQVSDPLRLQRADDRMKAGRQLFQEGRSEASFLPLYLARKLNPRDKNIRRYLAESAWQIGLAESARNEIDIARDLDPFDETIRKRAQSFAAATSPTDLSKRRVYNLYVFRLADDPASIRPGFGRLLTDALALYAVALTPFTIQALEPAVPFEKAEEVAHQKGADFFLHGRVGLAGDGTFATELGIFPVGIGGQAGLEFKEQHVTLKSRSDFTEDIILDTVKALHLTSSQFAKVVRKEREGYMIVDLGRRHGLTPSGKFVKDILGGSLVSDVTHIYEWYSRIRVQEIERARFIGIGDFLKQIER